MFQDLISLKFFFIGKMKKFLEWCVFFIDFEGFYEDICKEDDMEVWFVCVDKDGKLICLMGYIQSFYCCKKDVKCFLKQEFKYVVVEIKDCDCME